MVTSFKDDCFMQSCLQRDVLTMFVDRICRIVGWKTGLQIGRQMFVGNFVAHTVF